MQRAILKSSKPDLKILITETGVTPANDELGKVNNTYKALWWFEVLMNEICVPNVSYSFFWGVHTPWFGDVEPDVDVGTLLTRSNLPKPTGQVSTIVNRALLQRMVEVPRQAGFIRAYASASQEGDLVNVLLMNKDDKPQNVVLSFKGSLMKSRKFQRSLFKGASPDDRKPTTETNASFTSSEKVLKLTLPPLSISLLEQEK